MKNCCVCQKINSNYKCPVCREYYCSVSCCKSHKDVGCEARKQEITPEPIHQTTTYNFPTEDTVPIEKLKLLPQSEEVRECLKNPHVRDICRAIINDPDPSRSIALAMTEPIFVELADACLKVVKPQEDQK